MSKKKTGAEAPKVSVQKPAEEPEVQVQEMLQKDSAQGLDANHQVDLLYMMHQTFRMDPMAPTHTGFSQDAVNKINKITAAMQAAALIREVTTAKNTFTALIPKDMVKTLQEVSAEAGIHFNTKMLPAPDADGNIAVPSNAIVIDPKTKKKAKEESAIVEELPETDPSKIKTEEGLRKALIYTLADTKTNPRPYDRMNAAIDMFKSWKYFQAKDDAEKKAAGKISRISLLNDMIKTVGTCPFSMEGFTKILYNVVSQTKSPIPAFCMFRNNSKVNVAEGASVHQVDDQTVAEFVKALVVWNANSRIDEDETAIKKCEKNIATLSKNKKANAEAINKETKKIEDYKAAIGSYAEVIGYVTDASQEYADNLREIYDNKEHDDWKTAHRIVSNIIESYYPKVKNPSMIEHENLLNVMQQRIGKINNMFMSPGSEDKKYVDGVIEDIIIVEETPKEEEKPEEQPKK